MTAAAPFRRIDLAAAPAGRLQMPAVIMSKPFGAAEHAALAAGMSRRAARLVADELETGVDASTVSIAELLTDKAFADGARLVWHGADPIESVAIVAALGPAKFVVAGGDLRWASESVAVAEERGAALKARTGAEVLIVEIAASLPTTLRALHGPAEGSR